MSETNQDQTPAPFEPAVSPGDVNRMAIVERIAARQAAMEDEVRADASGDVDVSPDVDRGHDDGLGHDAPDQRDGGDHDAAPVADAQPAPASPAPQQHQQQAPQFVAVRMPDGSVSHFTPEQVHSLATTGIAALQQQQQRPQEPAPPPRPSVTDADRVRDIARRLQYGGEDEAAEAISDMLRSSASVDPNAIRQQVAADVFSQIQLKSDLDTIGGEFPDIFNSQLRSQAAALALNHIRADPRAAGLPNVTLYREACKLVRSEFGLPSGPQSGGNGNPSATQAAPTGQTRLERKRVAPSIPTAAKQRLGSEDDRPEVQTTSDVINEMKRARGQPIYT